MSIVLGKLMEEFELALDDPRGTRVAKWLQVRVNVDCFINTQMKVWRHGMGLPHPNPKASHHSRIDIDIHRSPTRATSPRIYVREFSSPLCL